MPDKDQEKLDAITNAFTRALIANPLECQRGYIELATRIATLIEMEVRFQNDREYNRQLMQAWGPLCN